MASRSPEASKARATRAEDSRRRRVSLAASNPTFFGEWYVRPLDDNWIGPLPELAGAMLGFVKAVRRGVLVAPPEHLKTTMVSQLYPLWLTYRYAAAGKIGLLAGMLLSEEQSLAERNLSVTAWHIKHNDRLRDDFVDVHGRALVEPDPDEDKWRDDAIIVRRPGVSKDPTWAAKGITSQGIQGSRLRHLIGDDVVTPASAMSPATQRKAKHIWDTVVTTRVLEDGQAFVAGNFNGPHDLLAELAGKKAYAVMRRPALHLPGKPEQPPERPRSRSAVVALPERWSRLRLLQELSEKPASFAGIYLLRSGQEGGGALKSEWVTRIARDDVKKINLTYLIGIDPAPGSETDPDPSFFSITAAALSSKHLDVLESYAGRMEPTEQVDLLADVHARYAELGHVGGIAVAKIALDRYFEGAVLVGHPELRPLLHEVSIPGSKTERLSHLGAYFRSGWARVVDTAWTEQTAGVEDRDQEETLQEQWTAFPNQHHDDRLDSLDVVIRDARQLRGGQSAVMSAAGDTLTGDLHEKAM